MLPSCVADFGVSLCAGFRKFQHLHVSDILRLSNSTLQPLQNLIERSNLVRGRAAYFNQFLQII